MSPWLPLDLGALEVGSWELGVGARIAVAIRDLYANVRGQILSDDDASSSLGEGVAAETQQAPALVHGEDDVAPGALDGGDL